MLHRSKSLRSLLCYHFAWLFYIFCRTLWSEKNRNPWNSGDTKNNFIEIGYRPYYRQGRGLHGAKGGNAHAFCNPSHLTYNSNHLKGDLHEQTRKLF